MGNALGFTPGAAETRPAASRRRTRRRDRLRHHDPDRGGLMSPALDLNAYVVGEMVGTGIWHGEREMSIGLHAHREDRPVWSHGRAGRSVVPFSGCSVGDCYGWFWGRDAREWPLPNCPAPKSSLQLIYEPTSSRFGRTQSPVMSSWTVTK